MEPWIVVIKVNDEPPFPAIVTGVVGPFSTSKEAENWTAKFQEKVDDEPRFAGLVNKSSAFYTIMPLSSPDILNLEKTNGAS